jgi:hypothetical protein
LTALLRAGVLLARGFFIWRDSMDEKRAEDTLNSLNDKQTLDLILKLLEKANGPSFSSDGRIATRARDLLEQSPLDLQRRAMDVSERMPIDGKSDVIEALQTWMAAQTAWRAVLIAIAEGEGS